MVNASAKVLTTSIDAVHTVAETGEVRELGTVSKTHQFLAPLPKEHLDALGLGPQHVDEEGVLRLHDPTPEQTATLQALGYIQADGG